MFSKFFLLSGAMLFSMTTFAKEAPKAQQVRSVVVFCSSSHKINPAYQKAAQELGTTLAKNKLELVFGGADTGLMGVLAIAAKKGGAKITSIFPETLKGHGVEYKEADTFVYTKSISERKDKMMESDAIVALPGGLGTLDELLFAIIEKQLGIHKKPIILVNVNQYWDPFLEMLKAMVKENTIKPAHLNLVTVINASTELMAALSQEQKGFLSMKTRWWEK